MPAYKFHMRNSSGSTVSQVDHNFDDDLDALDSAVLHSATHEVEIWSGERRVALVKQGNAPSGVMDSSAG